MLFPWPNPFTPNPFTRRRPAAVAPVTSPVVRVAEPEAQKAAQVSSLSNWAFLFGGYSADSAYRTHPWVHRCVRIKEQAAASVPLKLYQRGEKKSKEIESGPIADSLKYPNETMSEREMIEYISMSLDLAGNALVAIIPAGATSMLLPLNPRRVSLDRDGDYLKFYEYRKRDGSFIRFAPNEVIHVKYQSDDDMLWGVGPLEVARRTVYDDQLMRQHNRSILENGGVPRGVLKSDQNLTSDQVKENLLRWNESHQGAANAGRPAMLTGGFSYDAVGLTTQEIDFLNAIGWTKNEIASVMGVPASKLNNDERYANADVRERGFLNDTMIPLWELIADAFNNQMWKLERKSTFQPSNLFVKFDLSQVPELIRQRQEFEENERLAIRDGLRTINELREERGEDPLPWGDVWWRPLGLEPTSDATATPEPELDEPVEDDDEKRAPLIRTDSCGHTSSPRAGARPSKMLDLMVEARTVTFERKLSSVLRKTMNDIEDEVIRNLKRSKGLVVKDESVSEEQIEKLLFNVDDYELRLGSGAKPVLERAQEVGGRRALREVGKNDPFKTADPRALRQIRRQIQRFARPVNETTWEQLKETIREGIRRGETEAEIAGRVRGVMDNRRFEASRIAAFETNAAVSGGTNEGYRQSGVVLTKKWNDAGDENVRPTHAAANGQEVQVTGAFQVGNATLEYPGDPSGPIEETAGCRCALSPGQLLGEEGQAGEAVTG